MQRATVTRWRVGSGGGLQRADVRDSAAATPAAQEKAGHHEFWLQGSEPCPQPHELGEDPTPTPRETPADVLTIACGTRNRGQSESVPEA